MKRPPFHKYQDDMIDMALANEGFNLFARPGLGKTRVTLEIIKNTNNGPALVVAPLRVVRNTWPDENEKWGYNFTTKVLHGKDLNLDNLQEINLINYEGLPKLAQLLRDLRTRNPFGSATYDEISKLKTPGSTRFMNWRARVPTFDYRLGLSGTPVGNSLLNLWAEMFCVDNGASLGRRVRDYKEEFFYQLYERHWSPLFGADEKIFERIRPFAKSYDDDLLDLPPVTNNVVKIDLPQCTRAWYQELSRESTLSDLDMIAVNAGVRRMKERQLSGGVIYDNDKNVIHLHGAKKEAARDIIDELQGRPIMIAYEFNHDLENIRSLFAEEDFAALNGATKDFQEREIIAQWNAGELPCLAVHPKTAGHGLNLQSGPCTDVMFYTVPWSFEEWQQTLRRIWRQGQKGRVIAHYLEVQGTVDVDVMESAEARGEMDAKFMKALG